MAIYGRDYFTVNSRHINIRYLFINDQVEKGDLSVMYCPSQLILTDYFTKPLQGSLFHKFKNIIMGILGLYILLKDIASYSSKERVEKKSGKIDSIRK